MTRRFLSILVCLSLTWPSSLFAKTTEHCRFIPKSATQKAEPELVDALALLPSGATLEICQSSTIVDSVSVLSQVKSRSGVSSFQLYYFTGETADLALDDLLSLLNSDPVAEYTLMAIDPSSSKTHMDSGFLEANFISAGTFKNLYTRWTEFSRQAHVSTKSFDTTTLEKSDIESLTALMAHVARDAAIEILALGLDDPGPDVDLPRYEVILSIADIPNTVWEIEFDTKENDEIVLLGVTRLVE